MALVGLDGTVKQGKPSTELALHLEVYKRCPEARAVVHAHPPTAIAWTVARTDLEQLPVDSVGEVILATGGIPIVPYATPGTEELANAIGKFLPVRRALILARHGALTWGTSLQEAYNGMERIEHSALILFRATQLGGLTPLPHKELKRLEAMREKMGPTLL